MSSSEQPRELKRQVASLDAAEPGSDLLTPDGAIGGRAARSGAIRIGGQALQLVLGVGVGAALARLLSPSDFGLLAMTATLTAFVGSFRDFGMPNAIAHQRTLSHAQLSRLFVVNLRLNLLILGVLALLAPLLARFYGEPRLTAVTLLLALGVFIIGLANQHESLLMRQLRFGALTAIDTAVLVAGSAIAIGLALAGAGYWALVAQTLAAALLRSAALWAVAGWRPSWRRAQSDSPEGDTAAITRYGRQLTWFRVVAHFGRNLDRVVVGYAAGPAALGLYDRSYQWSTFPVQNIYGPLLNIAVATLSRVKEDAAAYRRYAHNALLPIFGLCVPALAFMVVAAEPIIRLVLGEGWLAAIPIFQLHCVAAFVGCMSTVTKPLYLSQGRTRRQLTWGLMTTPLMIGAVIYGARWGVAGVALGFSAATFLLALPAVAFCLQGSPLRPRDFLGVVWRPYVAALAAAAALLAARPWLPAEPALALELLVSAAVFGAAYLGMWLLLPGGQATLAAVWAQLRESRKPSAL